MPRTARQCPGGWVYHVWNRGAGRLRLFKKTEDYLAFGRILAEAHELYPIDILEWCLMPNHWHFVVHPSRDDQVTAFFRWLTHTHAMRAIVHRRVLGMGPLYQGRFKSLPVQEDSHLLTLLRYVQRNPLRGGLVKRCGDWPWTGERARKDGPENLRKLLSDWPIERPRRWEQWIDEPPAAAETEAIRLCIRRNRPYGDKSWTIKTTARLGLAWTLNARGRPAKQNEKREAPPK